MVRAPVAGPVSDLNSLSLPAQDDIVEIYRRNDERLRISSSRGCYGRCSFCSVNAFNELLFCRAPRLRAPKHIVEEIAVLHDTCGMRRFVFSDADFMGAGRTGKRRAREFADLLRAEGLSVAFKIDARANDVDRETVEVLKRAGLYMVEMGVESFHDASLRRFNKGITAQQTTAAIDLLCRQGVPVLISYIFYTPWTTMAEIRCTLPLIRHYLRQPRISWFPVFKSLKPIAGTAIFRQIRADYVMTGDYLHYDFRVADDRVEHLRGRHLAFTDEVESLLGNTPPLRVSGDGPAARERGSRYRGLQEALKGLCLAYLDALIAEDRQALSDCTRLFRLHREALRSLYDRAAQEN